MSFPASVEAMRHVYGGIDREGLCGARAVLLLAGGGASLRLNGRVLERPELTGAALDVWVEDEKVGELSLEPGADFEYSFPLPTALAQAEFVSVRLAARDWALDGPGLRGTSSVVLERVALE